MQFLVRQHVTLGSQEHIPKLKLQTQIKMMLRAQHRQEQSLLSRSGHTYQGLASCCRYFHPIQDRSVNIYQKYKNQQKISLKKTAKLQKKEDNIRQNPLVSSHITRNFKKNELKYPPVHTIPFIPQETIFQSNQPYINQTKLMPYSLLATVKSQQKLHSFPITVPSHTKYKAVTFQFINKSEKPTSIAQSLTHFDITSTKQAEKIDQTTCLEHQSQLSLSQNIKSKPQLNRFIPNFDKILQNQEEVPQEGQDQWSDESLSSETNLRFDQIDEEQSISDSTSLHHRNIVTVTHTTHAFPFQQVRKAHTIRSNLSHDDDNFSGHSIVLEKEHAFFITPQKRNERSENRHYSYGDF